MSIKLILDPSLIFELLPELLPTTSNSGQKDEEPRIWIRLGQIMPLNSKSILNRDQKCIFLYRWKDVSSLVDQNKNRHWLEWHITNLI